MNLAYYKNKVRKLQIKVKKLEGQIANAPVEKNPTVKKIKK